MMQQNNISKLTLRRLPMYLTYLKTLEDDGRTTISASAIASALGLGEVQVRKDLAAVSVAGKPKVGFLIADLMHDLEQFLCYGVQNRAVLVGVGNIGRALMNCGGFDEFGLKIIAAFDRKSALIGTEINGIPVLNTDCLEEFCKAEQISMGILTVPAAAAQECMDILAAGGVKAIWNFAPVPLSAPDGVLVQRENMASSLAILSYHLKQTQNP